MTPPRRVGRPTRRARMAGWWRRTWCGLRGHQWREVRIITHADLCDDPATLIERADWIVRCVRPSCEAVRSWPGPRGRHRAARPAPELGESGDTL